MAGKEDSIEMIDWNLAVKMAGGSFGMVFLLLALLALLVWITGLAVRKFSKNGSKGKGKGNK